MASVEGRFSDKQKRNLDEARRLLGLRSRSGLLLWFADHSVEVAQTVIKIYGGREKYLKATTAFGQGHVKSLRGIASGGEDLSLEEMEKTIRESYI